MAHHSTARARAPAFAVVGAATIVAACAILAAPPPAAAADAKEIDEIVVTASPLGSTLQPAAVLEGDTLIVEGDSSIGEVLADQLGLNSSYFGPAATQPIIRGLGGGRISVLSDRISSLDVSDVSPDHAVTVEPLLADRIEVIRGPATLLYGNAAWGGIVNVIDNRVPKTLPDRPVTGRFELRGDTAAEERAAVGRLDGALGNLAWHLDGTRRDSVDLDIDGFATADPAERPPEERRGTLANSFSASDGYAAGASWVGARGYFGVGFRRDESVYGLPGPEVEEEGEEAGEPLIADGPFIDLEQDRIDLRAAYSPGGLVEELTLAAGTNDYRHAEIEPTGEIGTEFDNDAWQARIELRHNPVGRWSGALGLQLDDRDFAAVGEEAFIVPTSSDGYGLFLFEEGVYDWGALQLGARLETLERKAEGLADYDEDALSLAAGVRLDIGGPHTFSINLTRTERHPNPEELYSNGAHLATRQFEIGLLAGGAGGGADKEVSRNVDVALAREEGAWRWRLAAFYNDIGDYVFQDLDGTEVEGLALARYAQDDAEFFGYEAEVEYHWNLAADLHLDLRVFSDYVRAELADGSDLPRIPPQRFGAGADFDGGRWRAGIDLIRHAGQDDVSSFRTGGYTMLDLHLIYDVPVRQTVWQLYLKGSNLLDEPARRATSTLAAFAPLPGASLQAGLRLLL